MDVVLPAEHTCDHTRVGGQTQSYVSMKAGTALVHLTDEDGDDCTDYIWNEKPGSIRRA